MKQKETPAMCSVMHVAGETDIVISCWVTIALPHLHLILRGSKACSSHLNKLIKWNR